MNNQGKQPVELLVGLVAVLLLIIVLIVILDAPALKLSAMQDFGGDRFKIPVK